VLPHPFTAAMPAQMRSLIIILDNPPMPRRRARTTAQLDELFALPTELNTLVRYWTLAGTHLAIGWASPCSFARSATRAASGAGRIDPGGSPSLHRPPSMASRPLSPESTDDSWPTVNSVQRGDWWPTADC